MENGFGRGQITLDLEILMRQFNGARDSTLTEQEMGHVS